MRAPNRPLLLILGLIALLAGPLACGPIGPVPGGRLDGELQSPPDDWSFTDAFDEVQLETDPEDPYSVNVWGTAAGGDFYIAAGQGADSTWAVNLMENPDVRLRVGDRIFELRAVRVEDEASRDTFLEALKRKYDYTPEGEDSHGAWLFRLEPRG